MVQQQCMQQLWEQCLLMIALPAAPRRVGLAVLLQYASEWEVEPPAATQPAAAAAEDTFAVSSTGALPKLLSLPLPEQPAAVASGRCCGRAWSMWSL